jgi:hypothetical protein
MRDDGGEVDNDRFEVDNSGGELEVASCVLWAGVEEGDGMFAVDGCELWAGVEDGCSMLAVDGCVLRAKVVHSWQFHGNERRNCETPSFHYSH